MEFSIIHIAGYMKAGLRGQYLCLYFLICNFSCTKFHAPDSQMKHLPFWKLMLRLRFSFLSREQPVSQRGLLLVNAPGIMPRFCPSSREISLEKPHNRVCVACMLKYPNNFANFHVKPF